VILKSELEIAPASPILRWVTEERPGPRLVKKDVHSRPSAALRPLAAPDEKIGKLILTYKLVTPDLACGVI